MQVKTFFTSASIALLAATFGFNGLAQNVGDIDLPSPLGDADFLYDGAPDKAIFELGRNLFFDPILSGNRNISCGTCHDPAFGSGDGLALGIGEGGTGAGPDRRTETFVTGRVPRNAQALWNIGAKSYVSMFHDGRVEFADNTSDQTFRTPAGHDLPADVSSLLAAQAFFPVTSPIEMAGQYGENALANAAFKEDRPTVWSGLAERVARQPDYLSQLRAAFEDVTVPADVRYSHIAEALAAFQTVAFRSDKSPFDTVLRIGDLSVLTSSAQQGLALFYGKAGCVGCHSGPLLTDHSFHAIAVPQIGPGKGHGADLSYWRDTGLPGRQEDEGRYRVSFDEGDLFAFRTPSLRNVALTGPWGHSGAFDTLEAVIRHHLDPVASLTAFDADSVDLPPLERVQRLAGRGSALSFKPLNQDRMEAFRIRDTRVMSNAGLRNRIARSNALQPVTLTKKEIKNLVSFLETLTDLTTLERSRLVPMVLPSGLPPQPIP